VWDDRVRKSQGSYLTAAREKIVKTLSKRLPWTSWKFCRRVGEIVVHERTTAPKNSTAPRSLFVKVSIKFNGKVSAYFKKGKKQRVVLGWAPS
jgi:hypothetical protein